MKKVSDKKRFFCGFIAVAPSFSSEKADKKRSGVGRKNKPGRRRSDLLRLIGKENG